VKHLVIPQVITAFFGIDFNYPVLAMTETGVSFVENIEPMEFTGLLFIPKKDDFATVMHRKI
jgi:hypothetical protein